MSCHNKLSYYLQLLKNKIGINIAVLRPQVYIFVAISHFPFEPEDGFLDVSEIQRGEVTEFPRF